MKLSFSAATVLFANLCLVLNPANSQTSPAAATPKTDSKPQAVKRLPDGHPDMNGFWASSSGPDTPVGANFGPRELRGRGIGSAKERMADPNQPPYKPELMEKVKELARMESKYDPAFFCRPGGVPRIGPPHAIVQAPGMPIVLLYQLTAGNLFRIIPVDGRPHDKNADESYFGDSIGRWDGDTLVVDSTNFNDDSWFGLDGWFHTTQLHVVERISRDGDTIRYQATIEDPGVFTKPWVMNPRVSKATTELILESPRCVETDSEHITDFGEKTKVQ